LLPPGLELPCPLCGDHVKSRGKSVESSEIDTVESSVIARTHHRDTAEFAAALGYPEAHFVKLALQSSVDNAGLDLRVEAA